MRREKQMEARDPLTDQVIGAAIRVHRALGPGLLESAYEACLAAELRAQRLYIEVQKPVPLHYREVQIETAYRLDLLVERRLIVELKAVEALMALHKAQLISYLRLADCSTGLLINFHATLLRDGVLRVVNNYMPPTEPAPS